MNQFAVTDDILKRKIATQEKFPKTTLKLCLKKIKIKTTGSNVTNYKYSSYELNPWMRPPEEERYQPLHFYPTALTEGLVGGPHHVSGHSEGGISWDYTCEAEMR